MIGSGLKKLALEHGMQIARGVAFGDMCGYATTLSEGAGYKNIAISTKLTLAQKEVLHEKLDQHKLGKEFRIQELRFCDDGIQIQFLDNPGTMTKIRAFIDWFYPCLADAGAAGTNICTECGSEIAAGGTWKLVNGAAYHLHPGCAQRMIRDIAIEEEQERQADTGSYARGLVGALLGAVVGAVVWALVLSIGYVASIIGLLIGWLAERGYRLLRGKNGKGKVAILIVAILLGIFLGTIGGEAIAVSQIIAAGEIPGAAMADIPLLIFYTLVEYPDYLMQVLGNIGVGILFAFLGTFFLLRKASKETGTKVKDL